MAYSINAALDIPYGRDTVKFILEKGARQGFIYHEYSVDRFDVIGDPIDINQALNIIIAGPKDSLFM